MGFELNKSETVPAGVRRVACERIDQALAVLGRSKRGASDRAVHEARKRFKEIRGALRLVREEMGRKAFGRENRAFRNAGRPLSAARDAKVLVDTLDGLVAHFDGRVTGEAVAGLRARWSGGGGQCGARCWFVMGR